jgi:cytosine/adenosine deaminase-related metal-dependent hydrolase
MTGGRRLATRAPFILAFDGRGHRLLRDGVVVIEDDAILHVGPRFDGRVDETVDAADRLVTPGLISTHPHIAGSPLDRSFIEDRGNPQFYMSLGTDTNPQSVIEALRWTEVLSKIAERNIQATSAADAFDAATLGGARALGRDDLGRLAPGAKADLVLWKARSWRMTPLRDPIKNLVYNATDEDVYVNGPLVVEGGRVIDADEPAILAALQTAGERMWPGMAKHDWAGRGADDLSPQTYQAWEG